MDRADAGRILIDGSDVSTLSERGRADLRRDAIGLVFQQFNLVPSLRVADNLAFQARLAGRHDPDFTARLSARLGLETLLGRYPEELSGGQQQRVAIGRAIAARPRLILADEPTGNLDETNSAAILDLLRELVAETGAALLMVTHSEQLARALSRRVHLSQGTLR